MNIQIINPTAYPDWDSLLLDNNNSFIFHTSAWAQVLNQSYGYSPIYFVQLENGRLSFLMPFMEVRSLISGKRGISLPFTDHCAPFAIQKEFLDEAVRYVLDYGEKKGWKIIEWRDSSYFSEEAQASEIFYTHDIDLDKTEAEIFSSFSGSNKRNIKKAIREGVTIKIEQSLDSLKEFYHLHCLTRKRHGVPPQPFTFFKNIFEYMIAKGQGTIISAFYNEKVIAAAVFFHFGKSALFKYGASNIKFQKLRPNNLIMWETIKRYRHQGFKTMNLGRTKDENHGLLRFKRGWGAKESVLKYYQYDIQKKIFIKKKPGFGNVSTRLFTRTPVSVLRLIGRLFYRHAR